MQEVLLGSKIGPARVLDGQGAGAAQKSGFGDSLVESLRAVESEVRAADELPQALVRGEVSDFHEVAAQIKSSELTFRFALEVRNKLIDAYRETMRMSV